VAASVVLEAEVQEAAEPAETSEYPNIKGLLQS